MDLHAVLTKVMLTLLPGECRALGYKFFDLEKATGTHPREKVAHEIAGYLAVRSKSVSGESIRQRREALGLTQAKLAQLAGTGGGRISTAEQGKTRMDPAFLAAIERALDRAEEAATEAAQAS